MVRNWRFFALTGLTVALGCLLRFIAPAPAALGTLTSAIRHPQSTVDALGVDVVVFALAAALAWIALAWLALALVLTFLSAVPGRIGFCAELVTRVVVPATARRALGAALGLSLLTGVAAAPALATPSPGPLPATSSSVSLDWPTSSASPTPQLDWPTSSANPRPSASASSPVASSPVAPSPTASPSAVSPSPSSPSSSSAPPSPSASQPSTSQPSTSSPSESSSPSRPVAGKPPHNRPTAGSPEIVVVGNGDTLWDIAAEYLGPSASDSRIAQEWPRWWAANRAVIGEDPDVIEPGQRLIPPSNR